MIIQNIPVLTGEKILIESLRKHLENGQKTTWLIPGGSNISSAVHIMQQLLGHEQLLSISLTDERFGNIGHADSNWQQLIAAGIQFGQAHIYPVLIGLSFEETIKQYEANIRTFIETQDVIIGQFGMGGDGHIAGILPNSIAAQESDLLVCGYPSDPFYRITTTFKALKHMNEAYCFAYGESKRTALINLQSNFDVQIQPAQILKDIHQSYVFNDQIGEAS